MAGMKPVASLCLLLLAAACQPPPPSAPVDAASEAASEAEAVMPDQLSAPISSMADLAGEYRVAGIDGEPLNESFGIALTIDPAFIRFDTECGEMFWATDVAGGALFTNRLPAEPRSCDTPVHPRLLQLAGVIDAASRAGRTPANGVELAGNGRSVLLFSQ